MAKKSFEGNLVNGRFIIILIFFALVCLICVSAPGIIKRLVHPLGSHIPSLVNLQVSESVGRQAAYAFFSSVVIFSIPTSIYLVLTPGLINGIAERMSAGFIKNIVVAYFVGVPVTVFIFWILLNIPVERLATKSSGGQIMASLLEGGMALLLIGPLGATSIACMLAMLLCAALYPFFLFVKFTGRKND